MKATNRGVLFPSPRFESPAGPREAFPRFLLTGPVGIAADCNPRRDQSRLPPLSNSVPGTELNMATKRDSGLNGEKPTVTVERAARLYQMLKLLGKGPQARGVLARRLRLDVRGFYRDLELLRTVGIIVEADSRRYRLRGSLQEALNVLPLPDPHLTLGEAASLAKGRAPAHRKLAVHLSRILYPKSKPQRK